MKKNKNSVRFWVLVWVVGLIGPAVGSAQGVEEATATLVKRDGVEDVWSARERAPVARASVDPGKFVPLPEPEYTPPRGLVPRGAGGDDANVFRAKKSAAVGYQTESIRFGAHQAHPFRILARAKSEVRQAGMTEAMTAVDAAGMRVEKEYQMVGGLMLLTASGEAGEKGSQAERLAGRIETLRASGAFEYVEPDWVVHAYLQPTDSAFTDGTLWGLRNTGQSGGSAGADINAEAAWDVTTGSESVVVGIIDSGIRYTHQDLAGNMWTNPGEIPGNGIDDDGNGFVDDVNGINAITGSGDPMDDNDHGTHVAGTIGATANDAYPHVGVAWNVQLMGLKFLDSNGFGSTSDAITCIEYAVANGANILNNSWGGGGFSEALRDGIEAANTAGILFVAAAGNAASNNDLTPDYPSGYTVPNVVSVAAHDRNDQLAGFSNYGLYSVDLGAPGVDIFSTVADSDSSYASFGGTSMASPHVAGVAALIASHHGGISVGELKQRLMVTVTPTSALANKTVSGGRVDAYAALNATADGDMELAVTPRSLPLIEFSDVDFFVSVADIAPVTAATVTGSFTGGPTVTFADDGVAADEFANDGVYSASVALPAASDPALFTVSASAPGKNPATVDFEMMVWGPPSNDNFADRIVMSGETGTQTANNIVATGETGEPNHAGVSSPLASAWWTWTAAESGPVEINTFGSDFDTTLAVYTGTSVDALTEIARNDDSGSLQSRVQFQAAAGQSYEIAVDGYFSAAGLITLNLVADNSSVRYLFNEVDDDRNGGSSGNGDGLANPGETVELIVTLENTGTVQENNVSAVLSTSDPYITSITDDTEDYGDIPPGGSARSVFDYDFTVDPAAPGLHTVEFSLWISSDEGIAVETFELQLGVSNDGFADRREIPSDVRYVIGSNTGFGGEVDEPDHAGFSAPLASAWWTWTPSSNMSVILNTVGSDFDTTLAVYQGNSLGSLVEVASNNDAIGLQSEVMFSAQAGQTYQIAVDGNGAAEGEIALNLLDAETTGHYRLEWSGIPHGNDANAVAIASIDLAQWNNPSQGGGALAGSGMIIHDMTVTGASSGNGTFGFSDFFQFFYNTLDTEMDFNSELVGQPLSGGGAWATTFDGSSGDFNLFSTGSAPSGTFYFRLTTDGGSGDDMNLVSFAPTTGPGSEVRYLSHALDDDATGNSDGNGDGLPDPGERIELSVVLENQGSVAEDNVQAVLTTTDPYVVITDGTKDYGTILPGATATSADDFDFDIGAAAPIGHIVRFGLEITSSEGVDTSSFEIRISPGSILLEEDFESGLLNPAWQVTGTGTYRTEITDDLDPRGDSHLVMDSDTNQSFSRNEVTLTLDLADENNVLLRFFAKEFNDELHSPPSSPFTDGADFDGVSVSNDGVNWYSVFTFPDSFPSYTQFTIDLDAAIARHGLNFNSAFRIRFNQYDNYSRATDGIAIDDIRIVTDPRPGNDNWQNAEALPDAPFSVTGSNGDATTQTNEPDVGTPGATVWWYFEAPAPGEMTIDTIGSDFDTMLHVYEGGENAAGVGDLSPVVSNDNASGLQSEVTFDVDAGKRYEVRVSGSNAATGSVALNGNLVVFTPTNDDWEDSEPLPGAPFTVSGWNYGATTQPNEPDVGTPGATVWWYFTATGPGRMTIDTFGSDFDTMLHVYEGAEEASGVGDLALVVSNDDASGLQSEVAFDVDAGKRYEVRVSGFGGATGNIVLNWDFLAFSGEPAAVLRGNGEVIDPGDGSPSVGDGTDWEQVVEGTTVSRTFTISNEGTGNAPLKLTGSPLVSISGSSAFTIASQPSDRVENGESTSVTVVYSPGGVSADAATVSFTSNDPAQPEFTFAVAGEGVPDEGSIAGTVWEDTDGDGVRDGGEDGLSGVTVYLDADFDGTLDVGETETVSGADGGFVFEGVASGIWQVAVVAPEGAAVTFPGADGAEPVGASVSRPDRAPAVKTTTSNSPVPTYPLGSSTPIQPLDLEFNTLVRLDEFRADPRFARIDGFGWAVAILDTGLDNDHDAFGPDSNGDGVADRVVFQHDYGNNDSDASAVGSAHGTNVASVAAASRADMLGVAPAADIINLKVFADDGSGHFGMTEGALQWVNNNVGNYQIASINMSLGDTENHSSVQSLYGIDDEIAAIAAQDCLVVSASGNSFFGKQSAQGVAYPSADPNSLSIGAVFDAFRSGSVTWGDGARANTIDTDRITPFSQRHVTLTTVFAPGAWAFGGGLGGGTTNFTGTSMASPLVAGVGVLAQQLAHRELGRRLTQAEFVNLLRNTAVTINDGDDEDDNVTNTGLNFPRVDMFALGEAILAMGRDPLPGTWIVSVVAGETVSDVDFGIQPGGTTWDDWQGDHFTPGEIADGSRTGPAADYDDDGIPNLIEFALGMDPTVGGTDGMPEHDLTPEERQTFTFRLDEALAGITVEVRSSTDLFGWTTIARSVDGGPMQPVAGRSTVDDPGGAVREITVTDLEAAAVGEGRFLRLEVTMD